MEIYPSQCEMVEKPVCAQEGDGHSEETNTYRRKMDTAEKSTCTRGLDTVEKTTCKRGDGQQVLYLVKKKLQEKTLFSKSNVY